MNLHHSVIAVSALVLIAAGQAGAASKPRVGEICLADFHKLCPTEELGRGKVIRCARAHIDGVSADCKSAVAAADAVNQARRAAKAGKSASAKPTAAEPAAS
jgi:hypothetical protein